MAQQEVGQQGPEGARAPDAPAPAAAQPVGEDLEALRRDLEAANRKGDEYLALLQRAQADFVNYRRRVEQERGESLQAGIAQLALRILPVLDDFDRAVQHMPVDLAGNDWVKGIELVDRKLRSALESEDIKRVAALGQEFNPREHEAMMHAPSSEDEAGKVIAVYREGYKQGNRVIRAAQVVVGKGP